MNKRSLLAGLTIMGAAMGFSSPAWATGVGLQLGSQSGVTVAHQDWHFGLGLDYLSFSADKIFKSRQQPALYYGIGGIVTERNNSALGGRAIIGAQTYLDQIQLYGELAPTLYILDDTRVELEGSIGFRVHF